jgi:hypothetical protein
MTSESTNIRVPRPSQFADVTTYVGEVIAILPKPTQQRFGKPDFGYPYPRSSAFLARGHRDRDMLIAAKLQRTKPRADFFHGIKVAVYPGHFDHLLFSEWS